MSNINVAFVKTYEGNVRHLAQQMTSRLMDTVQIKSDGGKSHAWDRLGPMEATESIGVDLGGGVGPGQGAYGIGTELERTDTPLSDAVWTRRISIPKKWDLGTTTEQDDPTKMLVDPNANLTQAVAAGMRRGQDDVIITAATGTALNEAGVFESFPVSQERNENVGSKLDLNLVARIQEQFLDSEIDASVQKIAVVPPSVITEFMKQEKNTSHDYVQAGVLQQFGIVKGWLGFDWRISTRLLHPTPTTTKCLFYTKRALGLQLNKDIVARVDEIPMKRYMWLIYSYMNLGAVRIEDEQIISADILS